MQKTFSALLQLYAYDIYLLTSRKEEIMLFALGLKECRDVTCQVGVSHTGVPDNRQGLQLFPWRQHLPACGRKINIFRLINGLRSYSDLGLKHYPSY